MESGGRGNAGGMPALHLRMLGPLTVLRHDVPVPLPASRKLRALIGYLALSPKPVGRSRLCELLWDLPNDPRGELRWCLSKMRRLLDDPDRERVRAIDDMVMLDLVDCAFDVAAVARAVEEGIASLAVEQLHALSALFAGDFLEGLEIERSPQFGNWLLAQRRRFRAIHASVLEQRIRRLPDDADETLSCLEKWLELFPFDRRPHEILLSALARRGRIAEGEAHLAAAARLFEDEGLDWRTLRDAWREGRSRDASAASARESAQAADYPYPGDDVPERWALASCRASLAVMPFRDGAAPPGTRGGLADGLAHDIITRLAKLRSIFVIAQGTVFALDQRRIGPHEAGRTLSVDYVVSGSIRRQDNRILVDVELAETRTARIVWAETFDHALNDTFLVLDDIGNRIVALIDTEIEAIERNRAVLKPPNSLNAWESHHRGLWHMYRFNRDDNEQARRYFQAAVRSDPTFARAYAGLSFTHFQSAFQHWGERERETGLAFEAAGHSLMADDRDPAAHWAMGRALWLRGQDESLIELQTAVDLSPNFALGHYTLAFVHGQSGDPRTAISSSDYSRHLSPFDPLLFGMLAIRAIALVRLGHPEEAAEWALKAAARPNAHAHIQMIAAHCLALAGRLDEARAMAGRIHERFPQYRSADFFDAFRFSDDAQAVLRGATGRIGLQ